MPASAGPSYALAPRVGREEYPMTTDEPETTTAPQWADPAPDDAPEQPPWWDMVDQLGGNRQDSLMSWAHHALLVLAVKRGGALATAGREGRAPAFQPIVDALVSSGGRVVQTSAKADLRHIDAEDGQPVGHHAWLVGRHAAARVDWMASSDGDGGHAQVEVVALGAPLAERIAAAVTDDLMKTEPAPVRDAAEVPVYMISAGMMGGSMPVAVGSVRDTFVEGNYTNEVLRAFCASGAAIGSAHPRGRLTIITGPTGTGKTHLLRGMIARYRDALFVMIDPELVGVITKPAFVPMLTGLREQHAVKPIVFVIEDGDRAVAERDASNLDLVQPLLNLGGGLAGDLFNVHVILTTNARVGRDLKIDKALQRKGRLAALIETDLLSPKHATDVYARLLPQREVVIFDAPVSLADVYDKAAADGWEDTTPAVTPRRRARIRTLPGGPVF